LLRESPSEQDKILLYFKLRTFIYFRGSRVCLPWDLHVRRTGPDSRGLGAGPGVYATLTGALLLWLVVLPPQFSWRLADPADSIGLVLAAVVGTAVSLLVGGSERARVILHPSNWD
jgi:Domain of unknown function (DUF4118)